MKYKILIIVNPASGRKEIKNYIPQITENFEMSNFQPTIKYTSIKNDATNIIKKCEEDYDVILICGGDGTLNQAIQGVYETNKETCVGFIPMGTTNDFAKSLNISFDKLHISENINNYRSKKIDTGIINDGVFNYVVAFGIFAKASYSTSRKLKQKIGRLAYIFSGAKELFNYKTYKLQIQTENENIEDEFLYGSISNSKYIGGFNIFKDKPIKLDDGKFEAVFVKKPKDFIKTMGLILKVLRGNLDDENIYYLEASNINIKCKEPIELSIDGEYGGEKKEITISNKTRYIEYLIPRNK